MFASVPEKKRGVWCCFAAVTIEFSSKTCGLVVAKMLNNMSGHIPAALLMALYPDSLLGSPMWQLLQEQQ